MKGVQNNEQNSTEENSLQNYQFDSLAPMKISKLNVVLNQRHSVDKSTLFDQEK